MPSKADMSFRGFPRPPPPESPGQSGMTQPASALYQRERATRESFYDDQDNALPPDWIRTTETQTWTTYMNPRTGQQQRWSPCLYPSRTLRATSHPVPPLTMTHTPDTMHFPPLSWSQQAPDTIRRSASRHEYAEPSASKASQISFTSGEDYKRSSRLAHGLADLETLHVTPRLDYIRNANVEPAAAKFYPPLDFAQTAAEWPPVSMPETPRPRPCVKIATRESKMSRKRPFEEYSAGEEKEEAQLPIKKLLWKQ